MTSNQQTQTFTVPVGTRLSQGIELEFLVAYLDTDEIDPDEENSSTLAPILRIDDADDKVNEDSIWVPIEEHIRTTLRDHGIPVRNPLAPPNIIHPLHLAGVDQWDVTSDGSVSDGDVESKLPIGKPGRYRWFPVELRSPACWDVPHAYDEIRFVVNLIKSKYRVRVNPTCGFHVHVGNGARYFKAETMKRLGAFLFAADPMISRLHAPWRRIGDFSTSVRYSSRLACWNGAVMGPADVQAVFDTLSEGVMSEEPSGMAIRDPIPVLPWSDRTREETDFGGKAGWEQYANRCVRDGPHITLSERPSTPQPNIRGWGSISSPSGSLSSSSWRPRVPLGSEDNEGGMHQRRLQELMATRRFQDHCLKKFGHSYPEDLNFKDLCMLLMMDRCEVLFGHSRTDDLSDEDFQRAVAACAPFLDNMHIGWKWNSAKSTFSFIEAQFGAQLQHPRPEAYSNLDGPRIIANMEAIAERNSWNSNGDDEDDIDDLRKIHENLFYDRVDELMSQPTFPLDNVAALLNVWTKRKNSAKKLRPTADSSGRGSNNAPASQASEVASSPRKSGSELSAGTNGSDIPIGPFFSPDRMFTSPQIISARSSSSFLNNPSTVTDKDRIFKDRKLHPHDINQLSDSYRDLITKEFHFYDGTWDRISWLPRPGGFGPPDRGESHPRGRECRRLAVEGQDCAGHPTLDTRAGVAALLGADSAAAVGTMLSGWFGNRPNYNFGAYDLDVRLLAGKRTIEFREAGGTLDPDSIVLWMRVCAGIVRFCRDASVVEYLAVLERVVREEERLRVIPPGAEDDDMYDVCDLLEDLCLFTEATTIYKREQAHGPPR
ncbi:hypothetical protein GGS24DRAFT_165375 [Hypoxylon argillaceum]|nr:hypothetical protein GGS24DRAFT_165375 [Hypoxylon argillaceum]